MNRVPSKIFRQVSIDRLSAVALDILGLTVGRTVYAFTGEMGAGKTTLIKEMCAILGVEDALSSPSYSIVNEYATTNNRVVYHMDLFRLKNPLEAVEIGIEDYLHSNCICFIEWPELIDGLLPHNTVRVEILVRDNLREISIFMNP